MGRLFDLYQRDGTPAITMGCGEMKIYCCNCRHYSKLKKACRNKDLAVVEDCPVRPVKVYPSLRVLNAENNCKHFLARKGKQNGDR